VFGLKLGSLTFLPAAARAKQTAKLGLHESEKLRQLLARKKAVFFVDDSLPGTNPGMEILGK
jgi:hypothetical protein